MYIESRYCFDVRRNAYILEHNGGHTEYLNSAYEVQPDGKSVNMAIMSRSESDEDSESMYAYIPFRAFPSLFEIILMIYAHRAIQLNIIEFSLRSGRCKSISKMTMEWNTLCSAVGGEYVMPRKPSMNGYHILIPYQFGSYDGDSPQRGAILFDYKQHLALLLSLEKNVSYPIFELLRQGRRDNTKLGLF